MKRQVFLFLVWAVIGSAQTPGQNAAPKLEPYQVKALENALRGGDGKSHNSFADLFSTLLPTLILTAPRARNEFANACVIPLLSVPVDPEIDRSIRSELKPSSDPMPAFKGLPSCGEDNQSAR